MKSVSNLEYVMLCNSGIIYRMTYTDYLVWDIISLIHGYIKVYKEHV
jgi:hypothetical protein